MLPGDVPDDIVEGVQNLWSPSARIGLVRPERNKNKQIT